VISDRKVIPAIPDPKATPVLKVWPEQSDRPEMLGCLVQSVILVQTDQMGTLVHKVTLVHKELKVSKVPRDHRVLRDPKVQLV
jgi:hypothetical protein